MMIAVFAELTVASNTMSAPLASVSFSVINASTFESVKSESSIFYEILPFKEYTAARAIWHHGRKNKINIFI